MTAPAPNRPSRWRRRALGMAAAALAILVAANACVLGLARGRIVAIERAPLCEALIVPGARIRPDGTPFDVLRDRLDTAFALWQRGAAPRIVLSGQGAGGLGEDEVAAMRRHLLARGVPAAALVDDGFGLRTLDTMDRAGAVYGLRSAIVVSNGFHVARAVFLGRSRGLETFGVVAHEPVRYTLATRLWNLLREPLARAVAVLDAWILRRRGIGCG